MIEINRLAETYHKPESELIEIYCLLIKKAKDKALRFMEMELEAGKNINVELFDKV
jgi:hypothetical protein